MRKQNGFTLIELMIVVAVIGVLSAIAIPQYQNFAKKGAVSSGIASLAALKTNVEDYISQNNQFPSADATGLQNINSIGSDIGEISIPTTSTIGQGTGSIKITFNQGAISGGNVTFTREKTGEWKCTYKDSSGSDDLNIAGCKVG